MSKSRRPSPAKVLKRKIEAGCSNPPPPVVTAQAAEDNFDDLTLKEAVEMAKEMSVVYAVEYIEVEFGERSEGYKLFMDETECIRRTKDDSSKGGGAGMYYGPRRPPSYVEVPFDSLEDEYQKALKQNGFTHTENRWTPRFKGTRKEIE